MRWFALSLVVACGARSDPGRLQPAQVLAPIPACQHVGTVAKLSFQPNRMVADPSQHDGTIYFDSDAGVVYRVSTSGGPVEKITDGFAFALDAANLYFVREVTLFRMPKGGGAASPLATLPNSAMTSRTVLAIDDTKVFFGSERTVAWVAKTGGANGVLASKDRVLDLTLHDSRVFFLTVDGVWRVSKTGGSADRIGSPMGGSSRDLVADDARLYWANTYSADEAVWSLSLEGGEPMKLAASVGNILGIAPDDRSVYWAQSHPQGAVWRISKTGAEAQTAVVHDTFPRSVVLDDACVYFSVERAQNTIPLNTMGRSWRRSAECARFDPPPRNL